MLPKGPQTLTGTIWNVIGVKRVEEPNVLCNFVPSALRTVKRVAQICRIVRQYSRGDSLMRATSPISTRTRQRLKYLETKFSLQNRNSPCCEKNV